MVDIMDPDGGASEPMIGILPVDGANGEVEMQRVCVRGKTLFEEIFIAALKGVVPIAYKAMRDAVEKIDESAEDVVKEGSQTQNLIVAAKEQAETAIAYSLRIAYSSIKMLKERAADIENEKARVSAETEPEEGDEDNTPQLRLITGDN